LRRLSLLRVLLLVAVAATTFLVLPGGAGSAALSCGTTVTQSIVLTQDLAGCPGNGIVIRADGVTIDLNGHSLSGTGAGSGVAIAGKVEGVTVVHGAIQGFSTGVLVTGRQAVLSNLTIARNARGVCVCTLFSAGAQIVDSVISHNAGTGLFFDSSNGGDYVARNIIDANGADGVDAPYGNDGTRYENNRFTNNAGYGLFIDSAVSRVIGNTASGNGAAGIHVFEIFPGFSAGYLIAENVADRNGGFGIEAPTNTFGESPRDGGGNAAKHNGNPAECLNIVCGYNRGQATVDDTGAMPLHPAL
jgi:parallel beta-helix repeat protein